MNHQAERDNQGLPCIVMPGDPSRAIDRRIYCRQSGDLLFLGSIVVESSHRRHPPPKTEIALFTESSAQSMGRYLRECDAKYIAIGTLTYPPGYGQDAKQSKEDLRKFLQEVRRYVAQTHNGLLPATYSVFWFMEWQSRGALHYHFYITHRIPYQWLGQTWARIVASGNPAHEQAGTSIETLKAGRNGTIGYARKYAKKHIQKEVPEHWGWVGRFWGVQGRNTTTAPHFCVDQEQLASHAVSSRIKALKKTIKSLEREKAIRRLPQDHEGSYAWVIIKQDVKKMLSHLIEMISIYAALEYNPDANSQKVKFYADP